MGVPKSQFTTNFQNHNFTLVGQEMHTFMKRLYKILIQFSVNC